MDKKKVLIVDDEEHIRLLVCSILGKKYIVTEVSNGEEAINIARRQKPDLILTDILMPKVDGYTACSAIKKDKETKAISVVMLTGIGYELNKKFSQEIGADGYITKPFSPQDLLHTVSQLLPVNETGG